MPIRLSTTLLLAWTLAAAQPASACALAIAGYYFEMLPPGVSQSQWDAQQSYLEKLRLEAKEKARPFVEQKALWGNSELVFVGRIESVSPRKIESFWGNEIDIQDVTLRPVAWLKGQGPDQSFTIGITSWSDCGPDKRWDALWSKPGETFIVFVEKGPPSNDTVREAIERSKIVDPEVNIALAGVE